MTLCEVEVYAGEGFVAPVNIAEGQPASQSSEGWGGSPGRGVDGNVNGAYGGGSCTHTNASPSWWQVDLGAVNAVTAVDVHHRTDCCQDRLVTADIFVSAATDYAAGTQCGMLSNPSSNPERSVCPNAEGQFVTVYLEGGSSGGQHMTLCEVEVYACDGDGQPACQPVPPAPPTNYARSQPAVQSSEGWDGVVHCSWSIYYGV
jgi:N-acetylgalactosamine 4-sulfate 6-O-sulfotransferase